ncbi:cytochrome-c oxidase, cbb3-type subunit II [Asticcacaulis sp. BYS171W]|uniref:Cytochrome-c oxidase, cbb3-type subunit II n=1 Tax=Asticcacaulis aquaticus TaxID=2984212 RepID=A0ABT5HWW3_9CAUL|nr:cytochrome-c oxidase, cbb3-type subunit II [Asticcacaulis aquaticus]MDC7684474.1 cytochrome-c oxidase, cbb3-type subunit II [Asticcacaulis aquaticus]
MLEKHAKLERNSIWLLIFTVIAVSIGGIIEIVPLFRMETTVEPVKGVRPYTPLELMGQQIYIREGCNTCHSQQIRPLRDEQQRYGHYSLAAESMYDHPFVWGSKRTGPDLARVGGKYSDEWHVAHLKNPRAVVPESIMPSYAFLADRPYGDWRIKRRLQTLAGLGVPYTKEMISEAANDYEAQANPDPIIDPTGLLERYGEKVAVRDFDGNPDEITEMDALIAYLQKLGTDVDFTTYNPDYVIKKQAKPAEKSK